MAEDWERKLRELERSIDGESKPAGKQALAPRPTGGDGGPPAPAEETVSSTRLLRWTVIGAGAGAGLVVTYLVLRMLVPYLILALVLGGVGYGVYRYLRTKSE